MKVEWLEPAKQQVQEIFKYLESVAGERTARKMTRKIIESTRVLAHNPRGGEREWLLEDQPEEFRRLVEGAHKIVYYIEDEIVKIVAIWDCRRDPSDMRRSVLRRRKKL